jgi:NAD(P)-dependent dehydrogenase (short-subunit alcohol dehydrogenase family)
MARLEGKVALITGGARGQGAAEGRLFAAEGAKVVLTDLLDDEGKAAAREVGGVYHHHDVTQESQWASVVAEVLKQHGRVDILVNNAGIGHVGDLEETALQDWQRIFRVNVDGVFLVTKAAAPLLLASPSGSIVNMGSVAGLVGVKRRFAYCASKGAVIAMTRQLAADYAGRLRVNCVCPGTVDTPFVEGYLEKYHKHEKAKVRADLDKRQPVGRLGKPQEIAHMVLYLCSDEAEFVTGSVMTIDGGWTAL